MKLSFMIFETKKSKDKFSKKFHNFTTNQVSQLIFKTIITQKNPSMFSLIYSIPGFAVVNKPFDIAMDGEIPSTNTTTVQTWAESDPQNLLKIAKNPASKEIIQEQNNQETIRPRNTKDAIDGKVRFVHQLDFATSGLLCLSFSKRQAAKVAYCFETRSSRKEYLAILDGWVSDVNEEEAEKSKNISSQLENHEKMIPIDEILKNLGESESSSLRPDIAKEIAESVAKKNKNDIRRILVSLPIGNDTQDPKGFKMRASVGNRIRQREEGNNTNDDESIDGEKGTTQNEFVRNAKPAQSIITVLAKGFLKNQIESRVDDSDDCNRCPVTLVHLQLLTGRRHQLRVHSLAIGHPIVGDKMYNTNNSNKMNCSNIKNSDQVHLRMMLHAWRLGLPKDQISLAETGQVENELFKQRRREIKQVRKQVLLNGNDDENNKKEEEDDDEEDGRIYFVAPEPLTQYFTLAK